jgi:hypothetical protein
MFTAIDRRAVLVLPLILFAAVPVQAQEDPNAWARAMFDSLSQNFGIVARGAEVTHRFRVKNLYQQDIAIANVTTSCGCTASKFDQTPVKPGDSTYVEVSMDTQKFMHEKSSTVTVTFAQPVYASVSIPVKVYIRTDVVVTPGSVNFGAVEQGSSPVRKLNIAYAGRQNWIIATVDTHNKYLVAKVVETKRGGDGVNGEVGYDLDVTLLPGAPVGPIYQQISLMTNDANSPEIPVIVHARVEADVMVTPAVVELGSVTPGTEITKTVVIRGHKQFVIKRVECESNRGAFKMPVLTPDSKPVHVLPLTFNAPKQKGSFKEKFIVTIEGRPEPIVFEARGLIDAPEAAAQLGPISP